MNQDDTENDFKLGESRFKRKSIGVDGSWQLTSETRRKAIGSLARRLMKAVESAWSRRKCRVPWRGGGVIASDRGGSSVSGSHLGSEILRSSKAPKLHTKRSKPLAVARGSSRSSFCTVGKKCPKIDRVSTSSKSCTDNEWREREVIFLNAANWGRMGESICGTIHMNDGYWTKRSSRA